MYRTVEHEVKAFASNLFIDDRAVYLLLINIVNQVTSTRGHIHMGTSIY